MFSEYYIPMGEHANNANCGHGLLVFSCGFC